MKTVKLIDLGEELGEMLEQYQFDSKEGINKVTLTNTKLLRNSVKDKAPVMSGKYKKSISYKKETSLLGTDSYVIYASGNQYLKAHLLEKSHALATGGRTTAQPHFEPAVKEIENKYINDLKEVLEGK